MNKVDWGLFKTYVEAHEPCTIEFHKTLVVEEVKRTLTLWGGYLPEVNTVYLSYELKRKPLRYALSVFHHECWHQRFEQKYLDNVSSYRFSCIKPLGQSERMEPIIEELFCRLFGWHDSIKALIEIRQGK